MIDEEIAHNLTHYVENGGILVLTAGSGVADEYGKSFLQPRPGPLRELTGVTVNDCAFQAGMNLPLQSTTIPGLTSTAGHSVADELHPTTAGVIATFADGWRKGAPAATLQEFGKGRVIYFATMMEPNALDAVVKWLIDIAGLYTFSGSPGGVSVYERRSAECRLLFLINWESTVKEVHLGKGWRDAFSGVEETRVTIPPAELRIVYADPMN
jgi:beta-galactosidase